jgi:hypothetical protein
MKAWEWTYFTWLTPARPLGQGHLMNSSIKIVTKTSHGLVPHITREHLPAISLSCVEFGLEGILDGDLFVTNETSIPKQFSEYISMKRFLSLRNALCAVGKETLSFNTSAGVRKMSTDQVINIIQRLEIDCFLGIPVLLDSPKKTTERTIKLLNQMLNLNFELWAPIHDELLASSVYVEFLREKSFCGYWIEAGNTGLLDLLPKKNIFVAGCTSLGEMQEWKKRGAVYFDNAYASMLTEEGSALLPTGETISLWDPKYKFDQASICPTKECSCFACSKHSRCYLQHLLTVSEMLGWTLLAIHNETMLRKIFTPSTLS